MSLIHSFLYSDRDRVSDLSSNYLTLQPEREQSKHESRGEMPHRQPFDTFLGTREP